MFVCTAESSDSKILMTLEGLIQRKQAFVVGSFRVFHFFFNFLKPNGWLAMCKGHKQENTLFWDILLSKSDKSV